jgi:hypothetical protein
MAFEPSMTDAEKIAALETALTDLCRETKRVWVWRPDKTVLIEPVVRFYPLR